MGSNHEKSSSERMDAVCSGGGFGHGFYNSVSYYPLLHATLYAPSGLTSGSNGT